MKSPFILIKESFAQYFSNIALYGGIYLLPTIGSYLLVFNVEDGQELALGTSVAFAVVSVILIVLNVYAAIALVKAVNDPTMTIMASFKQSYGFFWKYVLLSLLLGFMTLLGLLLLVVPGIMIMIYTSLAYIVLVLEDKGPIASCKQSYHYIKGQWWAVAWRLLVFVGFSFVYAFAFSLAVSLLSTVIMPLIAVSLIYLMNLILVPVSVIYLYRLYQEVKQMPSEAPVASEITI
ncbi:hypothetical protein H6783_03065 [Candidatus Nomurabacteria bacterium]|nr:hypothetical protein [Candidatus Nomurabacteria bacterium]